MIKYYANTHTETNFIYHVPLTYPYIFNKFIIAQRNKRRKHQKKIQYFTFVSILCV